MGPDCGTAIVNGVPLGFANVVRRGDIGLVAASGTGLQEVTCRIHNLGGGISQALGTGGRDLKEEIGGITMLQGLRGARRRRADARDRADLQAAGARHRAPDRGCGRRAPASPSSCISWARRRNALPAGLIAAASLRHAADVAVALARGERAADAVGTAIDAAIAAVDERGGRDGADPDGGSRAVHRRHVLLRGAARVHRPRPAVPFQRAGRRCVAVRRPRVDGHVFLDLGDDDYTRGRPHPMIDPSLRDAAVRTQGADAAHRGDPVRRRAGLRFARRPAGGSRRRWPTRSARRARTAARWR